jgi:peptidoglycan/xylan/chitin deacetylase (PgdA/CDA1 family)
VSYGPEDLRARRAKRAQARRRRGVLVAIALLVLAGAGVAAVVVGSSGARSRNAARRAPYAALHSRGSRRARGLGVDQHGAVGHLSRRELAAVQRIARRGLPLFCGGRERRMVAMTFDDGPGPYTTQLLAKLRRHHLPATFFVVGKQIRAFPGLAQRDAALAAVGDHTLTHPYLPALARGAMVQQIAGAQTLIEREIGQRVVLFRPPYEGRTLAIEREVRALGMLEVLWSVDSRDSLGADYAGIDSNVLAGLRPGAIILMHENHGQTIRALPAIFAALRRHRLRAVTIPELVADDPPSAARLAARGAGCAAPAHHGRAVHGRHGGVHRRHRGVHRSAARHRHHRRGGHHRAAPHHRRGRHHHRVGPKRGGG